MTRYLDLVDYLLIAEAATGVAAEVLVRSPRVALAESALHAPAAGFGGVEFYLMEQEGSRYSELETAQHCLALWKAMRK